MHCDYLRGSTLHKYRLNEPAQKTKPQTIFVCSMADLFGDWVPDEWIQAVFKACEAAPQHRYLFLTKNPKRYEELADNDMLPKQENMWYGSTVTEPADSFYCTNQYHTFVSIEPMLKRFGNGYFPFVEWVIIGAETGTRKNKVTPRREWVDEIINICRSGRNPTSVFLKTSLLEVMEGEFIQEYPWEVQG